VADAVRESRYAVPAELAVDLLRDLLIRVDAATAKTSAAPLKTGVIHVSAPSRLKPVIAIATKKMPRMVPHTL
jgi:hypothetical protein